MRFADDTKLGKSQYTGEQGHHPKGLDMLEEWADRNLMKISKKKCQVVHLGRTNLLQQHRLGTDCLGSSSMDKDQEPWQTAC